jgi:hypothetical protein
MGDSPPSVLGACPVTAAAPQGAVRGVMTHHEGWRGVWCGYAYRACRVIVPDRGGQHMPWRAIVRNAVCRHACQTSTMAPALAVSIMYERPESV